MDNCTSHSTSKMFEFYRNNQLKILFNTPYRSSFNMVELVFRHIKRETYTHIYDSFDDIKNTINIILNGELIKKSLILFYKETLNNYINFIQLNNSINLNI